MYARGLSLTGIFAWLLAGLTVLASVFLIVQYGVVEDSIASSVSVKNEYNIPLIIACFIASIYALLYAIMFAEVQCISRKNDLLLNAMGVQEFSDEQAALLNVISDAGFEVTCGGFGMPPASGSREGQRAFD